MTENRYKFNGMRLFILTIICRNSVVFYWKFGNLIGCSTAFYSPIENDRARVAFAVVVFRDFFGLKVDNIVGFGRQSFRVYTKIVRLLALTFYER